MLDEEFKERSRNVRRGGPGVLIFRASTGMVIAALLIAVIKFSLALGEARKDLEALSQQVASRPSVGRPQVQPVHGKDHSQEIERLSATVEELRAELARSLREHADKLATAERAAAKERLRLTKELDALKAKLRDRLVEAPLPSGGGEGDSASPEIPGPIVPEEVDPEEEEDPPVVVVEPPVDEEPEHEEYTIKRGDTISQIARKYKVSTEEILKLNEITDTRRIQIGQVLKIPRR